MSDHGNELQQWRQWCEQRLASVSAVPGNLSLISYQPIGENAVAVENLPGVTVKRGDSASASVTLDVPEGSGVTVDGAPVSGSVQVARLGSDGTPVVRGHGHAYEVFSLDGSDYELRVYSEKAEGLGNFDGIAGYSYRPDLVAAGSFNRFDSTEEVAWNFTRAEDSGHQKQVPGTVTVTVLGVDHEFLAFLDGDALVLVFADETTGAESYAPGRFLRIPREGDSDSVVVDFNRAFIPPCGFSDFYSCPIPPAQNRFPGPIRAGEREALWKKPRY